MINFSLDDNSDNAKNVSEPKREYDYLLGCLKEVAELLGKKISTQSLIANLPLENGILQPAIFARAAAKVGLIVSEYTCKINEIDNYLFPCIAYLENNKFCLIVNVNYRDKQCDVVFPETGQGVTTVALDAFIKDYQGKCFVIKKQYVYDDRSANISINKPKSWFWGTIKRSLSIYRRVFTASIFINLFALASTLFVMNVYDRVVPNDAKVTLAVMASGVIIVFLFDMLLKIIRVKLLDIAGKKSDIIMSARIIETVLSIRMASKPHSSGGFANEIKEFESLRDFFSSVTMTTFIDLPFVLFFLVVMYLIAGAIVLIPLIAIPVILVGSYFIQRSLQALATKAFREGSQKSSIIFEIIHNLETIKGFCMEGQKLHEWEESVCQTADSSNKLKFSSALLINYGSFIQQLSYVLTIIYGVFLIADGYITMGSLIAVSILSSKVLAPILKTIGLLARYNHAQISLEILTKIVNLPTEYPKDKIFVSDAKIKGSIEFKKINFAYPVEDNPLEPTTSINSLDNCSIKINPGEKIGLIGKIGSGKTTLHKLIMNFYQPDKGTILIDGLDINQISPANLRMNIGYIPQDIRLFIGTVRDNILLGRRNIAEASFLQAINFSGVIDFINKHSKGLDMPVGEQGCFLSGGQRQAIAIARAIITDPHILLMDEPTAMLDIESESKLIPKMQKYIERKTLILTTHKGSLLKLVNRLIVLNDGKILFDDNKEKVIAQLNVKK